MIQSVKENDGQWDSLETLMEERASLAIKHAFDGFGITYDEAFELLQTTDDLTDEDRVKRDILVAAVDNIVDFSVAEEHQMIEELTWLNDTTLELEDEEEFDDDLLEEFLAIFNKYNDRYAWVENMDIEYAMIMAAALSVIQKDTVLMYITMGDERVRPWHLQYEGYTAKKSQFPAWLIPPIEHGCRCYLLTDQADTTISSINAASTKVPEMPDWFDRTFKESVALGGRIFSDEHSYFQIDKRHIERLTQIATRIKSKYISTE